MISAIHVNFGIARTSGTKRFVLVRRMARRGWVNVIFNLVPGRFGLALWVTWRVFPDKEVTNDRAKR